MQTRATGYQAFLLRVWTPGSSSGVRASVTDVSTGEIHTFADLDRLHDWLAATARPEGPARLPPSPVRTGH